MAERVVQRFEVVQVDEQQCSMGFVAVTVHRGLLQPIQHEAPVGQLGQRVVKGQLLDFFLGPLAFGDVVDGCHKTNYLSGVIVSRRITRSHKFALPAGFGQLSLEFDGLVVQGFQHVGLGIGEGLLRKYSAHALAAKLIGRQSK